MSQKPKPPKRWTYKAFFELLPKDGWTHFVGVVRRCDPEGACMDCPVTAVARLLGHGDFRTSAFMSAAHAIGLPDDMAAEIADAADNRPRAKSRHRAALLKACNLKERNAK